MKIFNSLTNKKDEFVPIEENKVKIYACGPTVYDYFHLGNARPFIVFDTLRRYLEYRGYSVEFVQNFTDIDDKMIKRANNEGITVKELAEKYNVSVMTMVGFLDGINDSLVNQNPIEEMEEDTKVNLGFDKELLYKNMVGAGADWLYGLEEWNEIFDEAKRKELYKEQKSSTTIVKGDKVYPNDPCPCGSGKKYKKCCGKNK